LVNGLADVEGERANLVQETTFITVGGLIKLAALLVGNHRTRYNAQNS
jgi:hypothetical protein